MGADPTATKIWASCVCRYSCNNCSCWNRTNIKWFRVTCTTVILTNSKSQCRRTIPNYKCHKLACYQLHHTRDEVVLHQGLGPWTRWLRVSYSTNWVNGAFRALGRIRTYGGISTTVLQTAPFASSGHKRIEITVEIYLNGDVSSTTVIFRAPIRIWTGASTLVKSLATATT